jgi:hypothetical protein
MNAAFGVPMRLVKVEPKCAMIIPPELNESPSIMLQPNAATISPPELNESQPVNDISDQICEAVLHLQRDLDRVTARVRSLEVSALSGSLYNSRVSDNELNDCSILPDKGTRD